MIQRYPHFRNGWYTPSTNGTALGVPHYHGRRIDHETLAIIPKKTVKNTYDNIRNYDNLNYLTIKHMWIIKLINHQEPSFSQQKYAVFDIGTYNMYSLVDLRQTLGSGKVGRWDGKTYPKIAGEWMFIDDFYFPLHCNPSFTKTFPN
jgi:hypothetical protein